MLLPNQTDTVLVDAMLESYAAFFHAADSRVEWLSSEKEFELWLNDNTVLIGKIDRIGRNEEGQTFFIDDKSQASPPRYKREEWKASWGLNPQSLTYALPMEQWYPGTRRYCVRKTFKSIPPSHDFAWFEYTPGELQMWRCELQEIADDIRRLRKLSAPWRPNFTNCFRYGPKYVCPFYHSACSKLQWDGHDGLVRKAPHLEIESAIPKWREAHPDLVVLGASIVSDWLSCSERYRRKHEDGWDEPQSEALAIGGDFHELLHKFYTTTYLSKGNVK